MLCQRDSKERGPVKARTKDIDPGTPSGIKKWAEQRLALLEELRVDMNVQKLSKHFEFEGFQIQMWTSEVQDFLRIKGGCPDRMGFFLTKNAEGKYFARYFDAKVEEINPITGLPRPDPDPAKRTKFYVLPTNLQSTLFVNVNAAKFTGKMREVVGCEHVVVGKNTIFSHTYDKTHGLVEITKKFFIVEITRDGVWAAPLDKPTGCCAGAAVVTPYQPTDAEIAADPSLQQYRDQLSLEWAFSVQRPGVVLLIDAATMDAAYALGNPWYSEQGWAFSASGTQAQNVIVDTITHPILGAPQLAYRGTRHVITFTLADGVLTGALTTPDLQKNFTLYLNGALVAAPTSNETWSLEGATQTAGLHLISQAYTEDAPVHVYFDQEIAIVTRCQSVVEVFSSPGAETDGTVWVRRQGFVSPLYSSYLQTGTVTYWTDREPKDGDPTKDTINRHVFGDNISRKTFVVQPCDREVGLYCIHKELFETVEPGEVPTDQFSPFTGTGPPVSILDDHDILAHLDAASNGIDELNMYDDIFFTGSTVDDFFKHDISTFFLGTTGSNETAVSRIFGQHGNLLKNDIRYAHAAYILRPGVRVSSGVWAKGSRHIIGASFVEPGTDEDLLAFVGRTGLKQGQKPQ